MSWPFPRRRVATTSCFRRIDRNPSCRAREGRDHSRPSTVLYGMRLILADRRRAIFASSRSLPLGHGAHDQHDEDRRHRDRHFRFDG